MYDITPESNLMVLRIKNNDPQLKKLLFFFKLSFSASKEKYRAQYGKYVQGVRL